MKYIQSVMLLLAAICAGVHATAQCTGNCPPGSITISESSTISTLAAGSFYCISTTTDLSGKALTVNGTLVIQAGSVTLGNVYLEKTGVILVKLGARLTITGTLTGNSTAPVSTIDNLVVCNGGLLNTIGSFSQGQINIAVNDFGAMQVSGAWTAGASGSTVRIGRGSVIELCSSFNLNKNGFFTETSTDVSYLVVHGAMIQSVVGGFLSSQGNVSKIKFTSDASSAYLSHPAAYTCNACGNYNLAPTGTNSGCGSAANALYNTVLTLNSDPPAARPPDNNNDRVAIYPNPANKYLYLQLPKRHSYTRLSILNQAGQLVYQTTVKAGNTSTKYDLPTQLPVGMYFIQLTGNEASQTLRFAKD
jgi:hypothetical protein